MDDQGIPKSLLINNETVEEAYCKDWSNSKLYLYILESHTRKLLDNGMIKLGINETRPHTPPALKGLSEHE
jgi:hypothetical protein